MIKIIILLLFLISFTSVSQQNLKYFDGEMIAKNKINRIYEMISFNVHDNMKRLLVFDSVPDSIRRRGMSRFNIIETDIDTPWRACRNDSYIFDIRGNILYAKKKGKERRYFYEYNQNNEMINYYLGGYYPFELMLKTIDFKEYLSGDKESFQKILTNYQEIFDLQLSSKIDYTHSHYYNIRSSCSGILAKYKMIIIEEKNGLPILLKGQFIEYLQNNNTIGFSFGRDPDSRESEYVGPKYNEDIYIYYDYQFYK